MENSQISIKCIENYTCKYKPKKWNKEDDIKLLNLVASMSGAKLKWNEISKHFNKTTSQCFSRYHQINPLVKKGVWTASEDDKIKSLVKIYGKKWSFISKKINRSRTGKQIRDRYLNVLDEKNKKIAFSKYEDKKIIELFQKHGPKWSLFANEFKGRTGDAIKNRYNWALKKKFYHIDLPHSPNALNNKSNKNDEINKDKVFQSNENFKRIKLKKIFTVQSNNNDIPTKDYISTHFDSNLNIMIKNSQKQQGNLLVKLVSFLMFLEYCLNFTLNKDNFIQGN